MRRNERAANTSILEKVGRIIDGLLGSGTGRLQPSPVPVEVEVSDEERREALVRERMRRGGVSR